jgi:hypothetical protein
MARRPVVNRKMQQLNTLLLCCFVAFVLMMAFAMWTGTLDNSEGRRRDYYYDSGY